MGKLLIVDDDADYREVLSLLLDKPHRSIATAATAQEGLEQARKVPRPSLILLDVSMPGMDGREFLRRKNADPLIAAIPTIVVSGTPTALPKNASDLMAKPIDPPRLMALVEQYC